MRKLYSYPNIFLILLIVFFSGGYVFAPGVPMDMNSDVSPAMPAGPSISNVSVTDITDKSARVDINSDELVQGYVEYGTSEQYGMSTPLTSEFSTSPSFMLKNLWPETLYHYRVVVVDSAGNAAVTSDETFTTLATPVVFTEPEKSPPADTSTTTSSTPAPESAPAPSLLVSNTETASIGTSTARITWHTNKEADSQVEYGTINTYGMLTSVGAVSTTHAITLSNLNTSTKYYYRVISKTSSGETAHGTQQEFTTLVVQTAVAYPIISSVTVNPITASGATVSWITSKLSTSNIQYGTTTSYGFLLGTNSTLTTSHTRTLSKLLAGTIYHFRIITSDSDGNTVYGKDRTFTTTTTSATTTTSKLNNSNILSNIAKTGSQATVSSSLGGGGLPVISTRPLLLNVVPLDGQVLFEWKKDMGGHNGTIHTVVVRKEGTDPVRSRIDGEIVYDGPDTIFTDTNVENGKEYHYGLYSYGSFGRFSASSHFKVIPRADKEEVSVSTAIIAEETRSASALPFTRDLYRSMQSDDVKTLQTFLFANGYYPEGYITGYFGSLTKAAVIRFQVLNNISPAAGYVGVVTRGVMGQ